MTTVLSAALATCNATPALAAIALTRGGNTDYVVTLSPNSSAPERHAAEELSTTLEQVTGAKFPIVRPDPGRTSPVIAVGPGAAAGVDPQVNLDGLGNEGYVMRSAGNHVLLSGGRGAPRGTLYAAYSFLGDVVGCRWWTSKASFIPTIRDLRIPPLEVRYVPPLEYRELLYFDAYHPDWAARNRINGSFTKVDATRGGRVAYKGFVHTFRTLVPPEEHFDPHPEWYSLIKGKRVAKGGQLCLTNPDLQAFIIRRVLEWLKESPDASIVSVSQNDWSGACTCKDCQAVEDEEGSHSGPVLRLVNAVAAAVEKEHPHVAIDTLAYRYTRKPPRLTRPRKNVIVRLCSIECSFAHPMDSETNREFRQDLENWSRICDRLYVWDYVVDFHHYFQPHPNLRVLGPNLNWMVRHGVKGVLEQGVHTSRGGEMAELRAWVLARLLWNPSLDANKLIEEFLSGYYGPAAPFLQRYLQMLHDKVALTHYRLGCYSPTDAPYLTADMLAEAERLFQQALEAVNQVPELHARVEAAQLAVRYVLISRWQELRDACTGGVTWPLKVSRDEAIRDFERVCKEHEITRLAENGPGAESLRKKASPSR